MKKIEMHVVKTQHNDDSENYEITFVHIGTDYHAGWGLPMHAQKIIFDKTQMVDVFESGDRVICEVKRGSYEDEDGISSGGKWVKKTGTVEDAHGQNNVCGYVQFDDGDGQTMSLICGDGGYPGRNIQSGTAEIGLPDEVLKNTSYMDDVPETQPPIHPCAEPYRLGIGQGFGSTEDGEEKQ